MTEIEWREPPSLAPHTPRRGKGRWFRTLDALRKRPGDWAYVGPADLSAASLIKAGRLGGALPGEFEATGRKRHDGRHDIYARYVGGESA